MIEINKIYNGTCLDVLKTFDDNSLDSCVTDPPYGISFMNKHWDYDVPKVEVWKEVLRVLKPGGHLLCACGTRTQHRMAVNIEDAGFEIRDVITWHYGCLSDDTEVLTETGWKLIGGILNKKIAVYDKEQDAFRWEFPDKWNVYKIADTCYRIKSDFTDQLVSRNHRCLIERDGKLIFQFAQSLQKTENVPYLEGLPAMQSHLSYSTEPQNKKHLLLKCLQRSSEGQRMGADRMEGFIEPNAGKTEGIGTSGRKKSGMEGRHYLQEQEGILRFGDNKICEMPERVYQYEPEGRVCNGVQINNGSTDRSGIDEDRMCPPHRPQPNEQRHNEFNAIQNKFRTQKVRMGSSYNTTLATITPVEYSGIVFCPTVSTGAFVARRNGKIFITGNSGFPKSLNISKAIEKQSGVEGETINQKSYPDMRGGNYGNAAEVRLSGGDYLPVSEDGLKWNGWGTALKPATEFWTLARKPISEKTVAENVLKYGTGGINIDGSRIEFDGTEDKRMTEGWSSSQDGLSDESNLYKGGYKEGYVPQSSPKGRFPANVIFDEFTGKMLDEQTGTLTSGNVSPDGFKGEYTAQVYGKYANNIINPESVYGDSGGASRFFYCPKSDNYERNKGLKDFEKGEPPASARGVPAEGRENALGRPRANHHPTVKPIDLMRYLVKLITPKGGICIDPYCGSGTTLIGCKLELINYIGIERELEYCKIAEARIAAWNPDKYKTQTLF